MTDKDELFDEMKQDILNDESSFQTIEDDYEVVKRNHNQIMRMLRALPGACSGNQVDLDAITSALSVIERDLDRAIEQEVRHEINNRNEMSV